jgi:hypothetical protein
MLKLLLQNLKYKSELGYQTVKFIASISLFFKGSYRDDKSYISGRFFFSHDYPLDWENPKSLNEKLQLLKFRYNQDLHTMLSDKFAVRKFIKERFGEKFLIPLVFQTTNPNDISANIIPDYPVIIKANHDSGNNFIIRDKKNVDWKKLQTDCRWWLSWNYYYSDREQQYKNIERRIIVEKLLITKEDKIPNDYKLNFINGNLEFVYVSLDREGGNFRNIYDFNWKPLNFKWARKNKMQKTQRGNEISPPATWDLMKEIGTEISKLFPYVRVDFYDVDGKLYFGEITLCHGGGFDCFEPQEVDFYLGSKLILE